MGVLRLDQIAPDGLLIVVEWDKMKTGSSVFIPCINTTLAKRQIREIFERRGWGMRFIIRAEGGLWGIRVWRISGRC